MLKHQSRTNINSEISIDRSVISMRVGTGLPDGPLPQCVIEDRPGGQCHLVKKFNGIENAVIPSGAKRNRGIYALYTCLSVHKCQDPSTRFACSG